MTFREIEISKLQQYLPFTVLKPFVLILARLLYKQLQQYLPFTVLKLIKAILIFKLAEIVATVLTVYGIET